MGEIETLEVKLITTIDEESSQMAKDYIRAINYPKREWDFFRGACYGALLSATVIFIGIALGVYHG